MPPILIMKETESPRGPHAVFAFRLLGPSLFAARRSCAFAVQRLKQRDPRTLASRVASTLDVADCRARDTAQFREGFRAETLPQTLAPDANANAFNVRCVAVKRDD
jgi:hypothetical protein